MLIQCWDSGDSLAYGTLRSMALPTLQPYYHRRNVAQAEKLIVQRRRHEADVRERWTDHSRYFNKSDVHSVKQEAWTSSKSFQDSMNAYHSRGKEDDKRKKLLERREKLRTLIREEKEKLEKELKEMNPDQLSRMKSRAEALKTYREQQRKRVAEEKLVEHWRVNCPELRQVESRQMERDAHQHWEHQVKHRQQELESARKEKERYEQVLKDEQLAALSLEEENKRRKKMEELENADALQRQMKEIRAREEEAALLEQQQAVLLQEQAELEEAEEKRKKMEEAQKKTEHGRILTKQYKAQMRRKCQQIQEALELDLKILEDLAEKEKEEQVQHTARREKARADAEWMKKVVTEQIKLEKERETELDLLYQEEAARMWRRREAEWEREKVAREKLMNEVLVERQKQIQDRMETLKAKQAESIQRREELLQEMERENLMTARETRTVQESQVRRAKEIESQISERRKRAEEARLQYERELEEQRHAEAEYEELLREEESRITARGYQPKSFMKKKFAWY